MKDFEKYYSEKLKEIESLPDHITGCEKNDLKKRLISLANRYRDHHLKYIHHFNKMIHDNRLHYESKLFLLNDWDIQLKSLKQSSTPTSFEHMHLLEVIDHISLCKKLILIN